MKLKNIKSILDCFGGGYFLRNDSKDDCKAIDGKYNKDVEYTLTFFEALECVLKDECWVQGDNFAHGVVLRLKHGEVYVDTFNNNWPLKIKNGIFYQKYRKVYTQAEANK